MPKQQDYAKSVKGKQGLNRIIKAASYSKDGLLSAYRHESAFRQLVWFNAMLMATNIGAEF